MKRKIEQKTTPEVAWIRADKKRQGENSPESKIGIKDRRRKDHAEKSMESKRIKGS